MANLQNSHGSCMSTHKDIMTWPKGEFSYRAHHSLHVSSIPPAIEELYRSFNLSSYNLMSIGFADGFSNAQTQVIKREGKQWFMCIVLQSRFFICRVSSQPLQSLYWGWPLSGLGGWSVKTAWTYKHPRLVGLLWWAPRFTSTWRTARARRSTSASWTNSVSETHKQKYVETTHKLHFYCAHTVICTRAVTRVGVLRVMISGVIWLLCICVLQQFSKTMRCWFWWREAGERGDHMQMHAVWLQNLPHSVSHFKQCTVNSIIMWIFINHFWSFLHSHALFPSLHSLNVIVPFFFNLLLNF